jgi:MFS family permease
VESRAAEPILPLDLFRNNVFSVTSVISLIVGATMLGAITFLPLYLQIARGFSPTESGLLLVPMTIGIIGASTVSGIYMGRTGRYKLLPTIGMSLVTVGAVLLAFLSGETGPVAFGLIIMTLGFGMGCIFPVVTTAVQNAVPRAQLGTATAAGVMFRQIGGSLAVAAFGALFTARLAAGMLASGVEVPAGMNFGPQSLAQLPDDIRAAVSVSVVDAIHPIYWVVAGLGVLGFLTTILLKEVPLAGRGAARGDA